MSVKTRRAYWLGASVTALVASLSIAAPAEAQEATAPAPAQSDTPSENQPQGQPAPTKPGEKVERVVVTGSRLKKNEFTSSSPIQVITSEQTSLEGLMDTSDILQGSTLASGSQQINNQFTGFVVEGGGGVNTLSLRGLGATRTLVLLNGRRLSPAGTRGQLGGADLNSIPESVISRFEILKDGDSSIYGSDAVAGVVNAITLRNVDGAMLHAEGMQTFAGGGETYQVDGYWGETFDRGSFLLAFEYFDREELTFGDRDYLACQQDIIREGGPSGRILDIIDPATGVSKCFNLTNGIVQRRISGGSYVPVPGLAANGGFLGVTVPAVAGAQPDLANYMRIGHTYASVNAYINNICANAVLGPATPYCASASSIAAQKESLWRATQNAAPTDHPDIAKRSANSPVERMALFGQGSYDLTPSVELFGEFLFNRRESTQQRYAQILPDVCGANTGVAPAAGAAPCTGSNPNNPFGQLARPVIIFPKKDSQQVDFMRGVLGVRGEFGEGLFKNLLDGWSYDLYFQLSKSDAVYTQAFAYNDRVNATIGTASCNPAAITISGPVPCQPVNWFNPVTIATGVFPAEEAAFLFSSDEGTTVYEQALVSGTITGDLFTIPAGTVAAAVGFELRNEEIDDTPGYNARNSNFWGASTAGRTAGQDDVHEVFGEIAVPLLAGMQFAQSLTLDASGRYTNYASYGDGSTYKLGVNWQITSEYRARATTGTSFRAPALYELFLANQVGFLGQGSIDPCIQYETSSDPFVPINCAAQGIPPGFTNPNPSATIITGGGFGILRAETSESRTVGFIWTPDWLNLQVAVDYFEIEVKDQVGLFNTFGILNSCYSDPNFPTSPFCTLFTRDLDPASPSFGMILTVNNSYVNLNSQVTDGLDLTAHFGHEFSFGNFRADFRGTWTFTDEIDFFGSGVVEFNGEVFDPDFTGELDLRFDHQDWTFFWNVDMIARASNDEEFGGSLFSWRSFTPVTGNAYYKQYVEFTATHDASVRWRTDEWSVTAGVANVFDEAPPNISTASVFARIGNTPTGSQYDILGRRAWISVSKSF